MSDKTISCRLNDEEYQKLVDLIASKGAKDGCIYNTSEVIKSLIDKEFQNESVKTIKKENPYLPISRKALMFDDFSNLKKKPKCKIDGNVFYVVNNDSLIETKNDVEEFEIPIYKIPHLVEWDVDDEPMPDIIDRVKKHIDIIEDINVINCLSLACCEDHIIKAEKLEEYHLNDAFSIIEGHELMPAKILCHPLKYKEIKYFDKYEDSCSRDKIMSGFYGSFWDSDIYVSPIIPPSTIYILAPSEFVGVVAVKKDLGFMEANDPKRLKMGRVFYRSLGVCVLNDTSIAKIQIEDSQN